MKEIKVFEEAIANKIHSLEEAGINGTMFWSYRTSKEVGNELIDFADVIWDKDIEAIVKTCKENDIKEFTISTTMSGLIETLVKFEKYGFKMNGTTQVKARYLDWQTGEQAIIPAIKMSL